jgi:hypothetical protein
VQGCAFRGREVGAVDAGRVAVVGVGEAHGSAGPVGAAGGAGGGGGSWWGGAGGGWG